jgi:hypothetical protein
MVMFNTPLVPGASTFCGSAFAVNEQRDPDEGAVTLEDEDEPHPLSSSAAAAIAIADACRGATRRPVRARPTTERERAISRGSALTVRQPYDEAIAVCNVLTPTPGHIAGPRSRPTPESRENMRVLAPMTC